MSLINGLPAHVLLVHAIVVLVPLVSAGVILSALWPAARQRLVWPTLVLAAITLILTPITIDAGEWLEERVGTSPLLEIHAARGEIMTYVSAALFVAAVLVAAVHVLQARGTLSAGGLKALMIVTAVLAVVIGVGATVQVVRVGDAGARAVWQYRIPPESTGH